MKLSCGYWQFAVLSCAAVISLFPLPTSNTIQPSRTRSTFQRSAGRYSTNASYPLASGYVGTRNRREALLQTSSPSSTAGNPSKQPFTTADKLSNSLAPTRRQVKCYLCAPDEHGCRNDTDTCVGDYCMDLYYPRGDGVNRGCVSYIAGGEVEDFRGVDCSAIQRGQGVSDEWSKCVCRDKDFCLGGAKIMGNTTGNLTCKDHDGSDCQGDLCMYSDYQKGCLTIGRHSHSMNFFFTYYLGFPLVVNGCVQLSTFGTTCTCSTPFCNKDKEPPFHAVQAQTIPTDTPQVTCFDIASESGHCNGSACYYIDNFYVGAFQFGCLNLFNHSLTSDIVSCSLVNFYGNPLNATACVCAEDNCNKNLDTAIASVRRYHALTTTSAITTSSHPSSPSIKLTTTTATEPTTPSQVNSTTTQRFTTTTPEPGYCESEQWMYMDGHCYWSSVLNGVSGGGANANWYRTLVVCRSLHSIVIMFETVSLLQSQDTAKVSSGCTWMVTATGAPYSTGCQAGVPMPTGTGPWSSAEPGYCESEQWMYRDGHCYWSSVLNGVSGGGADANWYRALVVCRSLHSSLVAVHTQAQNEAMYPLTCAASVWLGLTATGNVTAPTEGWDWTDLSDNDFTHWAPEYPADGFGCSYQSTNGSDWFNDRDCQRGHMPFVCKKPADQLARDEGQRANRNDTNCAPGWTYIKGSCYWVASEAVDYFAAELDCRLQGSKIASVREEGVSGFLLVGLGAECQDLWIGLVNVNPFRMRERASWRWDDREPFHLDNWPEHAVPYDDRRKLCTAISTAGYWYNQHCWANNRYVCKRPPAAA